MDEQKKTDAISDEELNQVAGGSIFSKASEGLHSACQTFDEGLRDTINVVAVVGCRKSETVICHCCNNYFTDMWDKGHCTDNYF